MRTTVQISTELPRLVTYNENRVLAHGGGQERATGIQLALVADEQPTLGKDTLLLKTIEFFIDKDPSVHRRRVGGQ
jgi:hypothetical protein